LKLGNSSKLAARYCGPFEILERIGTIAYMLAVLTSMCIHSVFHVSFLTKYVLDVNHVIDWNVIQVEQEGDFRVQHVCILDWKTNHFQNQVVGIVNAQWNWYGPEDATWEHEDAMQVDYMHLFE